MLTHSNSNTQQQSLPKTTKNHETNPKWRPVISVDFDGVLHDYSFDRDGLRTGSVTGPAIPGAMSWLADLYIDRRVDVAIYSYRSRSLSGRWAMQRWMLDQLILTFPESRDPHSRFLNDFLHEGIYSWIKWPWFKPYAKIYIDDKAHCFSGQWPHLNDLLAFKPWNKP